MPTEEQKVTKMIYNVELGEETEHVLEVDSNNEIVAKDESGHFIKFPNVSEAEIDEMLAKHNAEASTQVKKKPLFGGKQEKAQEEPDQVS